MDGRRFGGPDWRRDRGAAIKNLVEHWRKAKARTHQGTEELQGHPRLGIDRHNVTRR